MVRLMRSVCRSWGRKVDWRVRRPFLRSLEDRFVDLKQPNVLLVDDDVAVLKTISRLLTHLGFSVIAYSDSSRALTALQERKDIAMLLCDYEMPEFDGVQLARAAKELNARMPVFILSGCYPPRISQAPWDAWFLKGQPVTELVHKLNRALSFANFSIRDGRAEGQNDDTHPVG